MVTVRVQQQATQWRLATARTRRLDPLVDLNRTRRAVLSCHTKTSLHPLDEKTYISEKKTPRPIGAEDGHLFWALNYSHDEEKYNLAFLLVLFLILA